MKTYKLPWITGAALGCVLLLAACEEKKTVPAAPESVGMAPPAAPEQAPAGAPIDEPKLGTEGETPAAKAAAKPANPKKAPKG